MQSGGLCMVISVLTQPVANYYHISIYIYIRVCLVGKSKFLHLWPETAELARSLNLNFRYRPRCGDRDRSETPKVSNLTRNKVHR